MFLPLWNLSVERRLSRLPEQILDGVRLLPEVLVEGLHGVKVLALDVVQLEPRRLLVQPPEAERVLVRRVQDVCADAWGKTNLCVRAKYG